MRVHNELSSAVIVFVIFYFARFLVHVSIVEISLLANLTRLVASKIKVTAWDECISATGTHGRWPVKITAWVRCWWVPAICAHRRWPVFGTGGRPLCELLWSLVELGSRWGLKVRSRLIKVLLWLRKGSWSLSSYLLSNLNRSFTLKSLVSTYSASANVRGSWLISNRPVGCLNSLKRFAKPIFASFSLNRGSTHYARTHPNVRNL